MKKRSKRFTFIKNKIKNRMYNIEEAISLIKEIANAKFAESVEIHVALNIDSKNVNQHIRTSIILPHGSGKNLKIAILIEEDKAPEYLKKGVYIAGLESVINKIQNQLIDFDVLLTMPHLMPKLIKLGKVLGPKGLMPSPKSGTVTTDLFEAINDFQKGKLEYRADKNGVVHLCIGKINYLAKDLKENILTFYQSIEKNKPSGIKGKYIKSFTICSTMSPSISIDTNSFKNI